MNNSLVLWDSEVTFSFSVSCCSN